MLVDGVDPETGALVGRTHREAPEIDGLVHVTGDAFARPGALVSALVTDAEGPDLVARRDRGGRDPRGVVSAPTARAKRFGPGAVATPANFITIFRLLFAIPTLILIAREGATWLTVSLWFVLSCTDGVDGWIARRDGTTRSGAFLDPLADKVLTIGGFLALLARGDIFWVPVAFDRGARDLRLHLPVRGGARAASRCRRASSGSGRPCSRCWRSGRTCSRRCRT